jgi:hypothetical protein
MNAHVIIPAGGFDRDSPYRVFVNTDLLDSALIGLPVLTPGPPNGSPIGFRIRIQVKDGSGALSQPSETTTYPVFNPASVIEQKVINGTQGVTAAGKAYAVVRAEDGDGTVDRRIEQQDGGAVGVADRVDAHGGSAEDKALRAKIITFYVNHPPVLDTRSPSFRPVARSLITRGQLFTLPGIDNDFLDPNRLNNVGGTPTYTPILRRKFAVLGKSTITNRDTCWISTADCQGPDGTNCAPGRIPDWIASGPILLRVRLCDCLQCDALPGEAKCPFVGQEQAPNQGTCKDYDIPYVLGATEPADVGLGDNSTAPRPGPTPATGRRQP